MLYVLSARLCWDARLDVSSLRAEAVVAALAGSISGSIVNRSAGALVSVPAWLLVAVVVLFATALWRVHRCGGRCAVRGLVFAVAAGLAIGLTLPNELPAPHSSVVTHALGRVPGARPANASDEDLFAALDVLDDQPGRLLGQRITVAGSWHAERSGSHAAVSQRVMACCAADAIDVGFDVVPTHSVNVRSGARVRVRGVVQVTLRDGETRYVLTDASVKAL